MCPEIIRNGLVLIYQHTHGPTPGPEALRPPPQRGSLGESAVSWGPWVSPTGVGPSRSRGLVEVEVPVAGDGGTGEPEGYGR